jgi:uncharacterized protein YjiS (DUF1127 family)
MYTAQGAAELRQTAASTRRASNFFGNCWDALREWRKCERLRADLGGFDDRALMDIGIARGEIDFVASNRSIEPRGVRSNPSMTD